MSTISEIGTKHQTDKVTYHQYGNAYERHLSHLRDTEFTLLEIGVHRGASMRTWREYFPRAWICGIDADPDAPQYVPSDVRIFTGKQEDAAFLYRVLDSVGNLDVVIDDGGHRPWQQLASFDVLWPRVTSGGWYVIEDLCCNYRKDHDGYAPGAHGTTVAKIKHMADCVLSGVDAADKDRVMDLFMQGSAPRYNESSVAEIHLYHQIAFLRKH